MKKLFFLIFFVALGAAIYWYVSEGRRRNDVQKAQNEIVAGAERLKDAVKQSLPDLRKEDIKEELTRTGKVVRKKAQQAGAAIADATADTRITATVKTRLIAETDLNGFKISVSTTDGVVTLAGSVSSEEQVAKAMNLALAVDGVSEVISTLQVKAEK